MHANIANIFNCGENFDKEYRSAYRSEYKSAYRSELKATAKLISNHKF